MIWIVHRERKIEKVWEWVEKINDMQKCSQNPSKKVVLNCFKFIITKYYLLLIMSNMANDYTFILFCWVPIIEYDTYNIQNIILFLPCGNIKVKE